MCQDSRAALWGAVWVYFPEGVKARSTLGQPWGHGSSLRTYGVCSADPHQGPTSCRQTLACILGPTWKRSQIQGDCRYLTHAPCKEVLHPAVRTAPEKPHSEMRRPLFTTGGKGCCGPSLEPAPCLAPASLWLSSTARSAQCLGSWTVEGGVCGHACNGGTLGKIFSRGRR